MDYLQRVRKAVSKEKEIECIHQKNRPAALS